MKKNDIIEKLFTCKNFNDCLNKMQPEHLREDLKQEVILVICELPEGTLKQLHNDNALEFYTVRVILNTIRNSSNSFAKKFRQSHAELSNNEIADNFETEERELKELIEDLAIEEIDKLYWYNKGLIELYKIHGNYRAIQKETGIPLTSIHKTCRRSFEQIKQKVKTPELLDQVTLNRLNLINTKENLIQNGK